MKFFSTIFLLALMLFVLSKDVLVFTAFKVNQEKIVEKWCVNKNAPTTKCKGKCYLTARLQKDKQQEQQQFPIPDIPETNKISQFFAQLQLPQSAFTFTTNKQSFDYQVLKSQNWHKSAFRPPPSPAFS